jgi:hypothetical protein
MTPTDKKKRRKRPTGTQEGPSLEERLTALYNSMGVTAAMARQRMEDPAIKVLREHTADATKERIRQASRTAEIIEDEFNKLREKYPDHDFRKDGPWGTARVKGLRQAVKERREQERLQPLKESAEADTIGRRLRELPFFDSDRDSD